MRRGEALESAARGASNPGPRASSRRSSLGTPGTAAAGVNSTGRNPRGMTPEANSAVGSSTTASDPSPPGRRSSSSNATAAPSDSAGGASRNGKGKARANASPAGAAGGREGASSKATHAAGAHNGGRAGGMGGRTSSGHSLGDGNGGNTSGGGGGDPGGTSGATGTEELSRSDGRASTIEQLRSLTKNCLEDNMPEAGAYYADKLVTFSGFEREDVLLLAKAQFACGAFLRTVHLLAQHRLLDYPDNFGLRACHLAARSLHAAEKTEESISLLEQVLGPNDADVETVKGRARAAKDSRRASLGSGSSDASTAAGERGSGGVGAAKADWQAPGIEVLSALCCLRGQAYANLDNRPRAAVWLKAALEIDARCVEALQCLTRWHLLSIDEQASMVPKLDYGEAKEESWLHFLFASQLNRPPGSRAQVFGDLDRVGLGGNLDVLAAKAECCYEQNDAQQALEICRQVFRADPHNAACLPVYLAAMVELKMKSQLFYTAHQLVEAGPKQAVSWFAVGCYYHLLGKNELAQRYFLKSTKLDGRFAPAWIGFGNAFAAQEETDQAVSAYRTAARLFQGSHLPLLYIGMEYVRTHNLDLARNFLLGALALSPSDPLVLNELGVVHFAAGEYGQAAERFENVLRIVQTLSSQAMEAWESTVFNLGHCHRKLGRLKEAAACYLRARELAPGHHSPHSALALTYHLQGKRDDAISCYHQALGLKPDDAFASEMLRKALQESFTGEDSTGLADLLSKTSLDTSKQGSAQKHPQDPTGKQLFNTQSSSHDASGEDTVAGGQATPSAGGGGGSEYSRNGGGTDDGGEGDMSFSFGEGTPSMPRAPTNEESKSTVERVQDRNGRWSNEQPRGPVRDMSARWPSIHERADGDTGWWTDLLEAGNRALPRGGLDFSTPVGGGARRGGGAEVAEATEAEDDSFEAMVGGGGSFEYGMSSGTRR